MQKYKFLRQKSFEKLEKFEKRVHDSVVQGWSIHSFSSDTGAITVLLEKI